MEKKFSLICGMIGVLIGILVVGVLYLVNGDFLLIYLIPVTLFFLGKQFGDIKRYKDLLIKQQKEICKSSSLSSIVKLSESIGHEFNNPLTIILGQVYLYRELNRPTNKEDTCYRRLLIIENEAKKLSNISEKFMALSKTSSFFNNRKVDLNFLAEKIYQIRREEIRKAGIDFIINVHNGSAYVDVDVEGVLEISSMLLDNSIYFTQEQDNPQIKVELQSDQNGLELFVSDNGSGIKEAIKDEIFKPLFTTKPNHEGIGLGLFIAKNIASAMNGNLEYIASEKGAVFKFSLR